MSYLLNSKNLDLPGFIFLNKTLEMNSLNKLMKPITLHENTSFEKISYNTTIHATARCKIKTFEPILKIHETHCLTNYRVNPYIDPSMKNTKIKIDKIIETVFGENNIESRNAEKFSIMILFLVDYFLAQTIKGQGKQTELELTVEFIAKHDIMSTILDLEPAIIERLLICGSEGSKFTSFLEFLDKFQREFGKMFPKVEAKKLKPAFMLVRNSFINYFAFPSDFVGRKYRHFGFPLRHFFRHSFDQNLSVEPFTDTTIDQHFFVVRASRDIEEGEMLTLNYERKGNFKRKFRVFDGTWICTGK